IVTFRHDAIPENFPGIVVVKGTDFVLQVSLDPLPAFRGVRRLLKAYTAPYHSSSHLILILSA
ncbi:hypothetical protein, partial [Ruminococcus sp.]|uniref:hypothetical protein n=1 Tax=Ruminococcus sp. TaxID=41978 RepID=UPI003AB1FE3E